ncbi:protein STRICTOSIDINE SYNTHASE-LIKE 10 [Typha latifolia]|uniref:protein STRICTOSIDINE SYNTHASE-LIKE 10 n=1 Tax=Typha latifolia TaxID=4733 RepID=UPI003C304E98
MNTKLVLVATAIVVVSVILSLDSRRNFEVSRLKDDELEIISLDGVNGPESFAFDGNGEGPYTGVSDGRILKWQEIEDRWIEFASSTPHLLDKCRGSKNPNLEHECGRPLGLKFNEKTGELFVADAYLGLLLVKPKENATIPIATQAQGIPFSFTNSLDIDQDSGVIYFTDSSTFYQRRQFLTAVISGDKTGRLLKFDPTSKEVQVLLDAMSFPNGVALSKDGSFLLIAETTTCRILKYWLQPPKASTFEVIAQLPGFPDNIKRSPRGGFWVAIHSKRGKLVEWSLSLPWLRQVLLRVPLGLIQRVSSLLSGFGSHSQVMALRFSEEGEVLEVLEGSAGRKLSFISEVDEENGRLWVGSVVMPSLGVYTLPPKPTN